MSPDAADYVGKIRSRGLSGTGITETILAKHHKAKGGRLMAVVSLTVAHVGQDVAGSGKRDVAYVIEDLEVAPDVTLEGGNNPAEFVRELVRSFYYERKIEEDGPGLEDGKLEPKVADAIARGDAHKPHPFLPTDAGADNPTCEVCGLGENAAPHRADRAAHPEDYTSEETGTEPEDTQLELDDSTEVADTGEAPPPIDDLDEKRARKSGKA